MTNQIQGEMLFAGVDTNPVYTPWMPVRGDIATFGVEVVERNGATLYWDVETRTLESTNIDSVFGTAPSSITGTGVFLDTNNDATAPADVKAKELVRYKFTTGSTANTTDFVVFRALQPSWQNDR